MLYKYMVSLHVYFNFDKQLLDEVFVTSRIIKVEVSVIRHCFKENNDKCIITPNTVYFQQAMFLHKFDTAPGNHALRHNLWIIP